jgi:hypothetical protein
MTDMEKTALQSKLDELSDRLRRRNEELTKLGEFSAIHQAVLTEIQYRSDALRRRVRETEDEGLTWQLIKAEIARDLSSLYDDLLQFEDRLDSEAMKKQPELGRQRTEPKIVQVTDFAKKSSPS